MKDAYLVKGHVEPGGKLVVDGKVPLPPGPVDVRIVPAKKRRVGGTEENQRKACLKQLLRENDALKCPPIPADGKTIDAIVYGI